jgi:hypothetical protein
MASPLVPDARCAAISAFSPFAPPKPKGGRIRGPNRVALTGILFVARPWPCHAHGKVWCR